MIGRIAWALMGAATLYVASLTPMAAAQEQASLSAPPQGGYVPSGRKIYLRTCATCHGRDLEGTGAPPLSGISFQAVWNGRQTAELYGIISQTMPPDDVGSLSDEDLGHVYAYLMSVNGYSRSSDTLEARQSASAEADQYQLPLPDSFPAEPIKFSEKSSVGPRTSEFVNLDDGDWPMYNRDYKGQRYSPLAQINRETVSNLAPRCIFQAGETGAFQTSPIVHDGRLFITTPYFTYALDAATCEKLWEHEHIPEGPAGSAVNRGAALYDGMIIRGTPDSHLIAIDAVTGASIWDTWVANSAEGYRISAAPAAYDGKIFVGEAGADVGATGRIHAFDAYTGARVWSFDIVPPKGSPAAKTWGEGAAYGGGSSWSHITVDPKKNQIYAPIGNPGSSLDGTVRPGSNLYTNSVVALDADTGKLNWYIQQVPHDVWDWDTGAAPALYQSAGRDVMAVASKDGWLYLYDEKSREQIAKSEISSHFNADKTPTPEGLRVCPGTLGGAEWFGPAYDPKSHSLFVNSVDWCTTLYVRTDPRTPFAGTIKFDPLEDAKGWLRAFDATTGAPTWTFQSDTPMVAGVTPTAGGLVFTGTLNGDFLAFDSVTGAIRYRFNTGGAIAGGVSSYAVDGKQYIAVASGNASKTIWKTKGAATLIVFGLNPNK